MKLNLNEYKFIELGLVMDGGSITLYFRNKVNEELIIDIEQFVYFEYYQETSKIPGRIYLNNKIIDKRSLTEKLILDFLNNNVLKKLIGLEKDILIDKINWIESKKYMDSTPIKLELSESRKKYLDINIE